MADCLHTIDMMTVREVSSHAPRLSELGKRSVVAAIMLPIVAGIVATSASTSAILFAAAAAIGCTEYYRLILGVIPRAAWVGIASAAVMPFCPALLAPNQVGPALFGVVAGASMLTWTIHLFAGPRSTAPDRIGHILAGTLFCSVGLAALSALRSGTDGVAWTAIVLVASWANDTAAYFVGRAFGRNKLWPVVSPHKTWEGLLGGLSGGVLGLLLIHPWLPRYVGLDACVALGALAGILGPLGDLCKSMLKRACHAKDSGRLIPGHGGMLDRIDAILFVAPIIWIVRVSLFPH